MRYLSVIVTSLLLLLVSGCGENEILTSKDVGTYCKRIKGQHISYERLVEHFEQMVKVDTDIVNIAGPNEAHTILLRIIAPDDIGGLDSCWHSILYDWKAQQVLESGDGTACQ